MCFWFFQSVFISLFQALCSPCSAHEQSGQWMEFSIYEELPVGARVGDMKSNLTLSVDDLQKLHFSLKHRASSTAQEFFSIDDRQGIISTTQRIDRELICPYLETCKIELAVLIRPKEFFRILKVLIIIKDLNDNDPVFPQSKITLTIQRGSPPGSLHSLIPAEDKDSEPYGVQSYHLQSDMEHFQLSVTDLFDGSKNLQLSVTGDLEAEQVRTSYNLVVVAVDGGTPPRSGSLVVDVIIADTNQEFLKFENSTYEIAIRENSPVGDVVVRVRDLLSKSTSVKHKISYSFVDHTKECCGDVFQLQNTTGDVRIKAEIDYEVTQTFQLMVSVRNLANEADSNLIARIVVHVLDENDNDPVLVVNSADCGFVNCTTSLEVMENAGPGTFVAHLSARDSDSEENGRPYCSLDANDEFELKELFAAEYKLITLVPLDREQKDGYDLTVTCLDRGLIPRKSHTHVRVSVVDENDNRPRMTETAYVISVDRNVGAGEEILTIDASDEDAGKNGMLLYSIKIRDHPSNGTRTDLLSIDPDTGIIRSNVQFSVLPQDRYGFVITVSDQGIPALSTIASLEINLVNTSLVCFQFEKLSYHLVTPENNNAGVPVGAVRARYSEHSICDRLVRDIQYQLTSPNDIFKINPRNGNIVVKVVLDREMVDSYSFEISATCRSSPGTPARMIATTSTTMPNVVARANVSVVVLDENDNAPVISNRLEYQFPLRLPRNASGGWFVTRVEAWDPDIGPNAALSFSIVSGNKGDAFSINMSSGVLVSSENCCDPQTRFYSLTVAVSDQGQRPLVSFVQVDIVNEVADMAMGRPWLASKSGDLLEGSNLVILIGIAVGVFLLLLCFLCAGVCLIVRKQRYHVVTNVTRHQDLSRVSSLRTLGTSGGQANEDQDLASVSATGRYPEMARSLQLAHAICRSMELSNRNRSVPQFGCDDDFVEDFVNNWTLNSKRKSLLSGRGPDTDLGSGCYQLQRSNDDDDEEGPRQQQQQKLLIDHRCSCTRVDCDDNHAHCCRHHCRCQQQQLIGCSRCLGSISQPFLHCYSAMPLQMHRSGRSLCSTTNHLSQMELQRRTTKMKCPWPKAGSAAAIKRLNRSNDSIADRSSSASISSSSNNRSSCCTAPDSGRGPSGDDDQHHRFQQRPINPNINRSETEESSGRGQATTPSNGRDQATTPFNGRGLETTPSNTVVTMLSKILPPP